MCIDYILEADTAVQINNGGDDCYIKHFTSTLQTHFTHFSHFPYYIYRDKIEIIKYNLGWGVISYITVHKYDYVK